MTAKQSARPHRDPFALSLSKGKRRPFILRQAQDERTQDTGERKSRLLRRVPHPTSAPGTPRNDTVWAFSTVPMNWDTVASNLARSNLLTISPR